VRSNYQEDVDAIEEQGRIQKDEDRRDLKRRKVEMDQQQRVIEQKIDTMTKLEAKMSKQNCRSPDSEFASSNVIIDTSPYINLKKNP
jgi:hypothetical protein